MKSGRRKPSKPRRPPAPAKARARRAPFIATDAAAKLRRERDEALAQQRAAAEVLEIIANSPGRLELIFSAILERATKICGAMFGVMTLHEGEGTFRVVALHNAPLKLFKARQRQPVFKPPADNPLGQVAKTKRFHHAADIRKEAAYLAGETNARILADDGGARSVVNVPLLKDGTLVGVLGIYRKEVNPFKPRQIELAKNFAAQAVIAIENARLFSELRQRTDDLTESLEQQTATSEVLKVISSSPGDLRPVFDVMLASAVRLCGAKFGTLFRYDGKFLELAAQFGTPDALAKFQRERGPFEAPVSTKLRDAIQTKQVMHTLDSAAEQTPGLATTLGGARSIVHVPMLKENDLAGVFIIYRQVVQPFTDKQIELVKNFAAQAVIAIENARLLSELRQRTGDLTEALEQQTATSEVLKVISQSPGDLEPVFGAMLENGVRSCEAKFGILWLREGDAFRVGALHGASPAFAEARMSIPVVRPPAVSGLGRAAASKQAVHVADLREDQSYLGRNPGIVFLVEAAGARTLVTVPMLRDQELVGAISIYRQEVRPFTGKQIELLQDFAAQAVIAIENARLLNELRQRTDDLSEALEQQTATAEILSSISGSITNPQPVFDAIVRNLLRLFGTRFAVLQVLRDGMIHMPAVDGAPGFENLVRHYPRPVDDSTVGGRVILIKQALQYTPVVGNHSAPAATRDFSREFGFNSVIFTPMLLGDSVIGAIGVARHEALPFDEKQVALIKAFANQAVIAIENARLFNELQQRTDDLSESLQQQTATADVLKVISRSTFDLTAVLDTLVKSAAMLCESDTGIIRRREGDTYPIAATFGLTAQQREHFEHYSTKPDRGSVFGRTILEHRTVHIPDILADPGYDRPHLQDFVSVKAGLGVPLVREGTVVGVFTLQRKEQRPFTQKQIELVETFADQAVIAIENVRLFDEIQDKSRQLEEASRHKSQFLANMSHELRTPLNAILGYTELILDNIYGDTPDRMRSTLERVQRNGRHLLGLINDVLDLSKIEAGQLTLAIGDYSLRQVVQDVFGSVEALAKEKRIGFKVAMPAELPQGRGDERRLTQVLLNLVGNAIKFTDKGEVVIEASEAGGIFKVAVRDTGPGISPIDQGRIFEEFQQADNSITKTKGGTGLGLAIARRIMELHGGQLWVESKAGAGSTFTFTLPVQVEQQARQT